MKNKSIAVSIIIPSYNASKILTEAICSVKAQTLPSWELLIVDDGSTDNSVEICQRYAKDDERIKVIPSSHQGVSATRNKGIEVAKGEWITFVDADDLLLDGFLEALYGAAIKAPTTDLCYGGYIIVSGVNTTLNTYKTKVYSGVEETRNFLGKTKALYRCSPWGKLFKRNIIMENNIRFDTSLSISEDRLFFYHYLKHASGIATTSYVGYIYGSFSPTSLKNKHFPSEMLEYRQKEMTAATKDVLSTFHIEGERAYLPVEHLLKILLATMKNVFDETGFSNQTVKKQQELYKNYFEPTLYEQISATKRWQNALSANPYMRDMIEQKFWKMNRKWWLAQLDLSIRIAAHKLLRRKQSLMTYSSTIRIINEKD